MKKLNQKRTDLPVGCIERPSTKLLYLRINERRTLFQNYWSIIIPVRYGTSNPRICVSFFRVRTYICIWCRNWWFLFHNRKFDESTYESVDIFLLVPIFAFDPSKYSTINSRTYICILCRNWLSLFHNRYNNGIMNPLTYT